MTHEELIEKVAAEINKLEGFWVNPTNEHKQYAKTAISTILTALQKPTEEMLRAVRPLNGNRVWDIMLNSSPLAGEKRGAE